MIGRASLLAGLALAALLAGCGGGTKSVTDRNGLTARLDEDGDLVVTDRDSQPLSLRSRADRKPESSPPAPNRQMPDPSPKIIQRAGATIRSGKGLISDKELGLPSMPDSTEVTAQRTEGPDYKQLLTVRVTDYSPGQVLLFYQDKFNVETQSQKAEIGTDLYAMTGKLPDGRKVQLIAVREHKQRTTVTIAVTK